MARLLLMKNKSTIIAPHSRKRYLKISIKSFSAGAVRVGHPAREKNRKDMNI